MDAECFARSFNRDDHPNGPWDPIPVQTTIEFRDMQATYTFPVGVTTLWWYAPNEGHSFDDDFANATATFNGSGEPLTFTKTPTGDVNGVKGATVKIGSDAEFDEDNLHYVENVDEQTRLFRFRRQS